MVMPADVSAPVSAWSPSVREAAVQAHQLELLVRRRCCHCAEVIPSSVILNASSCPKCARPVAAISGGAGKEVIETLSKSWRKKRWIIYPLIALAALVGGSFPFVAAILRFAGLMGIHVFFVRGPIRWLSIKRRMTTRFTLRLAFTSIAVVGLLIDVLMIPWPVLNATVATVVTLIGSVAYAEGARLFVRGRIEREAKGTALDVWEWLIPVGLVGALVAAIVGTIGTTVLALYVIREANIPLASDIARWIL